MISAKSWIRMAVGVLAISALLLGGCGRKSEEKRAEEMTEKMLRGATGKDVDVSIRGNDIRIEGQGSSTQISQTNVWPPDMFKDVPQFTAGKIEHVTRTQADGNQTFNVFFNDVQGDAMKNYAAALKAKGWQTQIMEMANKGGMVNAQKDNLGMNFSFNAEDKKGVLAVFSAP